MSVKFTEANMVFPGYNAPDEPPDYSYKVNSDNSFTIYKGREGIHTSRQYRLWVQADEGAKDWIKKLLKPPPDSGVTLIVHKAEASTKNRRI